MKKLPFLTNERLSRLMVSLLLCMGLLLPLMMTFGAGSAMALAVATAAGLLALFMVLGSLRRGRLLLLIVVGLGAAIQLALPGFGLFGAAFEAMKAIALHFNDVPAAAPLFARELALTLGIALSVVCYAFTSRSVGFFPATILVVLMLFGMWSLGHAEYLWYAAPALAALLLLVAQTSHEKTNLFEVLPMAVMVVLAALLILPAGRVTVEPLYSGAMKLKQTITDYLFFTDPRNVFTLGNYGYYPMGSGKLGGEAEPSDTPVMTVKTDRRTLLRAVAKDEYTGRSWRDTSNARRYLYVNPRWSALRERAFLESLPPASVQGASTLMDQRAVTVQMQDRATSTIPTPAYLRRFSAQSDMVAYFNDASELFITRDLQRGDRYTVFAPIVEGGDSALGSLIAAAPKGADKYYEDALKNYLDLPGHMEQKVFEDLYNIVSGYNTPYDKACAIMRHLRRYYRYTLEPKTPPENQDFVTYFLYVGKEGYCTYYASAMTVLCRMAGLPARYVEGFMAQPSADGFAYVTGKDAHAWTEVYFEGFGWVPFDATPSEDDHQQPPENEPQPTPTPTPPPQDQPTPTPEPPEDIDIPDDENQPDPPPQQNADKPDIPWLWLAVLALIIAAIVRVLLCMPRRVAARKADDLDKLFVYGNAAYALMKLTKRTPRGGETPLKFARRMDRQKAFPTAITPLWRMLALSNYSRAPIGPEQVSQAGHTFALLFKKQRLLPKIRFLLWAGFGRGLYGCLDTQVQHEDGPQSTNYLVRLKQKNAGKKKKAPKAEKPAKAVKPPKAPKGQKPEPAQPSAPAPRPEPPRREAPPMAEPTPEAAPPRRRRRAESTKEEP